jgi:hypothetical protein
MIACPFGKEPINLGIESGCKEKNLASWVTAVFFQPCLKASPQTRPPLKPPHVGTSKRRIFLRFRVEICQMRSTFALVVCLVRHSSGQLMFKNVQKFFEIFSTALFCLL